MCHYHRFVQVDKVKGERLAVKLEPGLEVARMQKWYFVFLYA
jgi:hypothetical protein